MLFSEARASMAQIAVKIAFFLACMIFQIFL